MAMNKNSKDSIGWKSCGARGGLLDCWCEYELVQSLWKSTWQFLRRLRTVLALYPAMLLLGIYPIDTLPSHKDSCSTLFILALFVIARIWKQPRCPSTEEWIQKMQFIYTTEYCLAIKNKGIMNFAGKWIGTRKYHPE